MKTVFIIPVIIITFGFSFLQTTTKYVEWIAPASANEMTNPLQGNAQATAEGKKTFTTMCAVCHGEKGKGDGIGGLNLNPKPRNFTLPKTQLQTDGALFWKLSEGRLPMASYKTVLTPTQRWQLVNYLRTFKKP